MVISLSCSELTLSLQATIFLKGQIAWQVWEGNPVVPSMKAFYFVIVMERNGLHI